MTENQILESAYDAYEAERGMWTIRKNKMTTPTQWEVIRVPPDGDPQVMATAINGVVADQEMQELRGHASIEAALRAIAYALELAA